jgi:hypothetical protein
MSDVRERLESHRKDVLILLQEASRTAQLYEGVCLADAVSHLARAQALLAEELDGLSDASKQEEGSPEVATGGESERSTSPINSL